MTRKIYSDVWSTNFSQTCKCENLKTHLHLCTLSQVYLDFGFDSTTLNWSKCRELFQYNFNGKILFFDNVLSNNLIYLRGVEVRWDFTTYCQNHLFFPSSIEVKYKIYPHICQNKENWLFCLMILMALKK